MKPKDIFRCEIASRFNDIDAMGHVNNALIFTYFEEGRKALFYNAFGQLEADAFNFIMAHIECDFIRPIRLADQLLLDMWVPAIGTKSFGFGYVLLDAADNERLFAKGSSVQVCYDYNRRQSIPVPENLRKVLSAYLPTAEAENT